MKNELYNLTSPQKSILFTEQFYKGSSVNNICGTAIIHTEIDFDVLKKAVNVFVENNDSFQLRLVLVDNEMRQFKADFKPFNVEVVDLNSTEELSILEEKMYRTPFDVFNEKRLYDVKLFRYKDNSGGFIFNVHHLIGDSWALGIVAREVVRIYECLLENIPTPKNEDFSYINYIKAEKEYANSSKFQKDKEYWDNIFTTIPEPASIPATISKNEITTNFSCEGKRNSFTIPKNIMDKINEYCKLNNISVFNFFMAVYSLYIGRVSNLNDFVIGTPILNRTNFKEKNTTGMFINIAPLRININNAQDFKSYALTIAKNSMSMLRHQKYSYQYILEDLRKRDVSLPNLYNIVLSYQITSAVDNKGIPYETTWSFNGNCADDIDIHLYDLNNTGSIIVAYDYKIAKFEQADIENIHSRSMCMIEQILNSSDIYLNNIDILTEKEKQEILHTFNNTHLKYDKTIPLIHYFEEQAEKTPDATALTFEGSTINYATLNEKANSLAYELRNNGITNNSIIGIMVQRSFEMIISILAVLKAGGAYIPIDPEYPIDRINYMIEDSKATILLTTKNVMAGNNNSTKLEHSVNCNKIIYVDIDSSIYNANKSNLENISKPEDLSYIIYTSGSTGKPKGVMLTQKNLTNFYNAMLEKIEYLKNGENFSIVSITTVSFDIFGFETLISLTNGLNVYITNYYEQKMTEKLEKLVANNNIDIIQTTPSVMRFHLDNLTNTADFSNLKYVMLAGEQLPKNLVNRIKQIAPKCTIYNGYGPSETTIFSTVQNATNLEEINIGKPIANTQIYILDSNMNLLPKHHIGEIYISGDGVGKGYLYKQELTNAAFLKNPFNSNSLLYKTGDLGLWLDNGCIECKGRIDHQVKLHGLRIELGEIENKINSYVKDNSLKSAVIIKNENGKDYLCAFIGTDSQINTQDLKAHLLKLLPNYMVPTYIMQIEKIPQTPNGKTDRKALLNYDIVIKEKAQVKPKTQTEQKLYELVAEITNNQTFSMTDDLFALGMDSLNIISLSSKILKEFNSEISIKEMYSIASLVELANLIEKKEKTSTTKISKAKKQDFYKISSAQKRVYLACKMDNNSILYNMPGFIKLPKNVDISKLMVCLDKLIKRHEILRTCFIEKDDGIYQYVLDKINLPIENKYGSCDKFEELVHNFVKPFNLQKTPLFRIEFLHIDDDVFMLFDIHHIICDGLSLNIFVKELCDLYNGKVLQENELSYIDYAEWENIANLEKQEQFWLKELEDLPVLNMPLDTPRPLKQSFKGNKFSFNINTEIFNKIQDLCLQNNITPYMFLLSCYTILLSKYCMQEEIIVGSPIANRLDENTNNILGMFVNNIILKTHPSKEMEVLTYFKNIKETVINATQNCTYPFNELVNKLNIKRDTSRNAIFDTMFIYQNDGIYDLSLNGSSVNIEPINTNTAKFDLSFEIIPSISNTIVNVEYCTDLFKFSTIDNLCNGFLEIIADILNNPKQKIGDVNVVSKEQKELVLNKFNNTKTNYPKDKSIASLFEEQVLKTPNKTALVFEEKRFTYNELNIKANQLAHYLKTLGIEHEDIVCILLDKSIEMIIAILAILKAGGAYLPIDVYYPKDRIDYIIRDSKAKVLLTNLNFVEKSNSTISSVCIDLSNENIYNNNITKNIENTSKPSDLAYIMYTSGSTGNPKGTMIEQKSVIRLVKNTNYVTFEEEERILQTGSIVFDACTFEIWAALLNGFELFIIKKEDLLDANKLQDYLIKNKITILWLTAPLFNQLSEENPKMFNYVKYLLTGGDVLSPKHINMVRTANPNLTIINGYGPTENTTFSCCYIIDKNYETSIPIGYPIANSTCYVVSSTGKLLPVGFAGELWVGGDGVARGYLNNPELSNEKFIDNPYDTGKLYKTGDLARFYPDGRVEFLGRIDSQVKIRGFRVELNEINTKIAEYPNIKECATVVHNINNEKTICTYIVSNKAIDITELKAHLKSVLPVYMIPTYIMQLNKLPLNTNGKVDKKALPTNFKTVKRTNDIVKPNTENEKILLDIFKKILNFEDIGVTDNFFDLGGDSLGAMKIQIEALGKDLNINYVDIFKYPTVRELGNVAMQSKNNNIISKVETKEFYPVSSAQKRMYLASIVEDSSTLYNISGGIIFDRLPDINKLENALNTIIKRHLSLRTYFEIVDGEIVQKIIEKLDINIVVKQANTSNIDKLFKKYNNVFNLNKAPLWNINLLNLPNNKAIFIFNIHHIIFDGTSLNNFMKEVTIAYNNQELPQLPISYIDYATWENKSLLNNSLKNSKEFWINQFKNDIPILNLPTTYSRPATKNYEGKTFISYISKELTTKINNIALKYNITPYMFMLSAYYVLLYKYTSQEDIIVGSPIAGRLYKELEPIIGMFVNTLPLRNKVSYNLTFEEFLDKVKNVCMEAFSHQDYPFDVLINDLNINRDNSRNPLFDTMFTYQNNGFEIANFDEIIAHYYIPTTNTSKFDISLEVLPMEDELKLSFEYCTKLFDSEFITRFSNHYVNILNTIIENVNIKIADICMLGEEEKEEILYKFNNTKIPYPEDKTIAQLFKKQVEKTPNNIAVIFGEEKLTYKELDEKSNQLAWYLNQKGIGNGDVVAISMERSIEIILCMIAILKSGAAYLPIDPSYPKGRIDYIIQDSGVKFLLTKQNIIQNFSHLPFVVAVDLESSLIFKEFSTIPLNISTSPDDLAYLIYTSGSTGNPKGVMLTNRNVNNFIVGANNRVNFNNYSTIVSVTTMCFDIFVLETILPLELGLTVVFANDNEQNIPALLNNICIKNNVEILQTTPSRMGLLISDSSNIEYIKNLKCIMLGGEACTKNILTKLKEITEAKVFNMYGPTETTVWSTIKDLTNTSNITIGTPIANTQIYILNKDLNVVPIGLPGELYIGGVGVSRGYLNREKLTKEKFIQNPFIQEDIIYNTGDLASWNSNGEINCLGRSDFQVKIRGLRIELGEIEKQILQYPNISNVIVCAKKDTLNREFLCGYFVASTRISISELKNFLSEFLPNYMVPSYFMQLDNFKYTPNGKIDRKSLPIPQISSSNRIIEPETTTEIKLVNLFEKLLCISPISITDNFFEIGGDSILALKLQIELLNQNIEITYADIFKYSTVKDLALKIDASVNSKVCFTDKDYDNNLNSVLAKNTVDNISINYKTIGNVLLTGSTGFLGAHILDNIISSSNSKIYCLVRRDPGINVTEKFINKLHYYFGNKYDDLIDNRIFVIEADVTKEDLSLPSSKIEKIFKDISHVINSVAIVKHYGYYSEFERVNVNAVKYLVKYCEQYNKKFVQISTISVSGNTLTDLAINRNNFTNDVKFKENSLFISQSLDNVYVRSKYEAEKFILKEIYYNSLNAIILRIGNITNRFSDGVFQPNAQENAFMHRITALLEFKAVPEYLLDKYSEFSPVDYVASAIVHSIEYVNNDVNVLHIYNQNHLYIKDLVKMLSKYNVKVVSEREFTDIVKAGFADIKRKNSLSYIANDFDKDFKLVYDSNIKINNDFSNYLLSKTGFKWPIIDENYINKLLENY